MTFDPQTVAALYSLGLAACAAASWAIRRKLAPSHFAHTDAGGLALTAATGVVASVAQALASGHITVATVLTGVAGAVASACGGANPTIAAQAAQARKVGQPPVAPPSSFPTAAVLVGLTMAGLVAGCGLTFQQLISDISIVGGKCGGPLIGDIIAAVEGGITKIPADLVNAIGDEECIRQAIAALAVKQDAPLTPAQLATAKNLLAAHRAMMAARGAK